MSNRHLARTIAMQSLYEWDFLDRPTEKVDEIIDYNKREFAPEFDDGGYIEETVSRVIEQQEDIDELIARYAPDWPLATMTVVDRNILRLGAYELKFSDGIPSKVAINEAIELAKTFGGEASGKFVNGVLGAVYKDMIKEGKEKEIDVKKKKDASEDES